MYSIAIQTQYTYCTFEGIACVAPLRWLGTQVAEAEGGGTRIMRAQVGSYRRRLQLRT